MFQACYMCRSYCFYFYPCRSLPTVRFPDVGRRVGLLPMGVIIAFADSPTSVGVYPNVTSLGVGFSCAVTKGLI
jgi:hypothetical protein